MRKATLIIFICTCFIYSCKKDNVSLPKQIYLNIPFELTSKASCFMLDTIYDSLSNSFTVNTVFVSLKEIKDYRSAGVECMSSTGGYAEVKTSISINNVVNTCVKSMPGCICDNEWDTTNTLAPKCNINVYKVFLLKLNPTTCSSLSEEKLPSKLEDYSVKYVFKKQ